MKSGDENESLDTVIRQNMEKEQLLAFSAAGDSPVQWIQLLRSLDQQELPSWPLLTPLKVQMLKCEKCSWEFCSPINYRRHIRMHRRSPNIDKESHKLRGILAAFWDKLSLEEVKEIVSFEDVMLKEVSGSLVINECATSICKTGVWMLPQGYVKAGSILLEVIHGKPSRLPISSQELFCILDDASERTFLCAGTAGTVQNYVFDADTVKSALELKNLVACISFLFELNLMKAWLADKDAEALRCQKLLVEEEEAAQLRQAELLEKRKQKKLRLKEMKAREESNGLTCLSSESPDSVEESPLTETFTHKTPDNANLTNAKEPSADIPYQEPLQLFYNVNIVDTEAQIDIRNEFLDSSISHDGNPLVEPRSEGNGSNGFYNNQQPQVSKFEPSPKHALSGDHSISPEKGKLWTKTYVSENEGSIRHKAKEAVSKSGETKCELIIGSISIPVVDCSLHKKDFSQYRNSQAQGKQKKHNLVEEPAVTSERGPPLPAQRANKGYEDVLHGKFASETVSNGSCLQLSALDNNNRRIRKCFPPLNEATTQALGLEFEGDAAKALLAERWKEAVAGDHVKLVLSPDCGLSEGIQTEIPSVIAKAKEIIRTNSGQSIKVKYIPKQKVAA